MNAEKTDAIILRVVEFSETSCIVTALTRDFGKISGMAKGARRRKSPFEGALDLLSTCRIVFRPKTSGTLDLLTEAKLLRRFRAGRTSLCRLYGGFYVIELVRAMTEEHDPNTQLFDLVRETISQLDGDEPTNAVPPGFRQATDEARLVGDCMLRFEMRLLKLIGQFPSMRTCVSCGNQVDTNQRVAFGLIAGGVLCDACRMGNRAVVRVSAPVIQWLELLGRDSNEWMAYQTASRGEARGLIDRYWAHVLGRELKTGRFLRTACAVKRPSTDEPTASRPAPIGKRNDS